MARKQTSLTIGKSRLQLTTSPDHFISRAPVEKLAGKFDVVRRLSPHSVVVRSTEARLNRDMLAARKEGPAFRLYLIDGEHEFSPSDRLFVRFKSRTTPTDADAFGRDHDLIRLNKYSDIDYLFRLGEGHTDPVESANEIASSADKRLRAVEVDPNFIPCPLDDALPRTVNRLTVPDRLAREQWHLSDEAAQRKGALASMRCDEAWDLLGAHGPQYGSKDVVIGFIDSGFYVRSPELDVDKIVNAAFVEGRALRRMKDITGAGAQRLVSVRGGSFHGGLCATAALASVNNIDGVGVAPNCSMIPVNAEVDHTGRALMMSASLYLDILKFLNPQVDIISQSWHRAFDNVWPTVVVDAIRIAATTGGRRGKGIVFIWSAGNDNCPLDYAGREDVPIDYDSKTGKPQTRTEFVNPLIRIDGVMHVAAISSQLQRCHYSNYGDGVTVCAPSNNEHSYTRLPLKGVPVQVSFGQHMLLELSGTSASTALVSGVAALVISANPDLSAAEVVDVLRETARREGLDTTRYPKFANWDISPVAPFDDGSFKRPTNQEVPWSPWFGHGMVDAAAAVEEALRLRGVTP